MKTLFLPLALLFSAGAGAQTMDHNITLASLLKSPLACFDDINCPPGSHCLNGSCVFQGTCNSDVDCGAGRRCVNGACR